MNNFWLPTSLLGRLLPVLERGAGVTLQPVRGLHTDVALQHWHTACLGQGLILGRGRGGRGRGRGGGGGGGGNNDSTIV